MEQNENTFSPTQCGDLLLFATKTCPNCKQAEHLLEENGVKYRRIFAEDHPELAEQYDIRQAPTLIDTSNPDELLFVGIGAIRRYVLSE